MDDEQMLKLYMEGFNDELNGTAQSNVKHLMFKQYRIGADHALLGDDNRNLDYLSNEEILNLIR